MTIFGLIFKNKTAETADFTDIALGNQIRTAVPVDRIIGLAT